MKNTFLLSFLLLYQLHGNAAQFNYLKFDHAISSSDSILKGIYRVWNILLKQPDLGIKKALLQTEEQEIIKHLLSISVKLSTLEEQVSSIADTTIETILQAFPKVVRLEIRLYELSSILAQINFAEEQMRRYLNHGYKNSTEDDVDNERPKSEIVQSLDRDHLDDKRSAGDVELGSIGNSTGDLIEKRTMLDFALWATKHDHDSVMSLLNRLKELVSPKENSEDFGIFNLIKKISEICFRFDRRGNLQSINFPYGYNFIDVTFNKPSNQSAQNWIKIRKQHMKTIWNLSALSQQFSSV